MANDQTIDTPIPASMAAATVPGFDASIPAGGHPKAEVTTDVRRVHFEPMDLRGAVVSAYAVQSGGPDHPWSVYVNGSVSDPAVAECALAWRFSGQRALKSTAGVEDLARCVGGMYFDAEKSYATSATSKFDWRELG